MLEGIIASNLTRHLESQHLLNARQFIRSSADLNLLLASEWSDALDQGRPTPVLALDIAGAFDRVWHAALIERLHDYLQERHMRVVHNGQQSSPYKIGAGVPQGSVVGPLLWNIYINDLLNLIPSARAYADDITVSISLVPGEEAYTTSRLNSILRSLEAWGQRWQVTLAPHKTQLLLVSRTDSHIHLIFNGTTLTQQQEINILGVTYDSKLTFRSHISQLARTAAGKLASLRRISWLLDCKGRQLLYKAQIRSTLEYACLAWGGAAPSHLSTLDKIQRRAARIIWEDEREPRTPLDSLQHRRDVAGLTTLYKVQQCPASPLTQLHQPLRRVEVNTRSVAASSGALEMPRSNTWHHQRQFVQVYTRWWNMFSASYMCPDDLSVAVCGVQKFKVSVNQWLKGERDTDTAGEHVIVI